MKTTAALLVAGSMLAISAPAMAQDSDSEFDGFRVEALAGYDVNKAGSSDDDDTTPDNDQSIEGIGYGVGVGYDYDAGGVVLGLEAELADSTADVDIDAADPDYIGFGNVGAGRDIYVGARVGFKANDDLLVYGKGGYTNARYDFRVDQDEVDGRLDADGWRVGAGLEYAMSGNTFAKVEYRYSNYTSAEIDYEGNVPDVDVGEIDLDRHQVMAGFGVRF